mgnify:CR=1 FL=1|jgi:Copper chaperone
MFAMFNIRTISCVLCSWMIAGMAAAVSAGEVRVEGVHLCCGGCVKAVSKSLEGVDGVSDVQIDKDEELVRFNAKDDAAAQKGLTALAASGLYGTPSTPGPDFKVSSDKASDQVKITKVHLCCRGCVTSVEGPLKKLSGVQSVKTESKQGTIILTGSKINHAAVLKSLHESGFHGQIE